MTETCKARPLYCAMEDDYPSAEPLLLFLYLYGNWTMENGAKIDSDEMWRKQVDSTVIPEPIPQEQVKRS